MEYYNIKNYRKNKKLFKQIRSGELNQSILYYINEARTFPKDFSRHLMINDDVSPQITKLSLFFKYSSPQIPPLQSNKILEKSSSDLLSHIISLDDESSSLFFSQKEKERNNLKERLKKYKLIPVYHLDLLIIGVDNAIDALSNILINKNHRNKILSPDMKYIGISSGILPSGRLCIVIDIVSSFRNYNNYFRNKKIEYIDDDNTTPLKYNYIRFTNIENDNENNDDNDDNNNTESENNFNVEENDDNEESRQYSKKKAYFNPKYFPEKSQNDNYQNFNLEENNKILGKVRHKLYFDDDINKNKINRNNEDIGDLRITTQKSFRPSNRNYFKDRFYNETKAYKMPIRISLEKNYSKDKYGNIYPIYHKKILYDDGSILLQPYFDE